MTAYRRTTRAAVCATALLVGLAACAGPGEDEPDQSAASTDASGEQADVLPAESLFVAAPDITVDASGTSATLSVTTDLDMACAVVFGQTEALGDGIATDDDMGGGAHADHSAVMRGLEPDTLYYYRVQGSGADGRLYQGELATFRTPAAEPSDALGPNAALDAEITQVSSEFNDSFAGANAVDGDPSTEWSTAGDGDDASLTLDLGEETDIVGFGYRGRSMSDGTAIVEAYSVTVDGTEYGPFPGGTDLTVTEAPAQGQVITFDAVTTTGGNTGAAEIEIYTSPSG